MINLASVQTFECRGWKVIIWLTDPFLEATQLESAEKRAATIRCQDSSITSIPINNSIFLSGSPASIARKFCSNIDHDTIKFGGNRTIPHRVQSQMCRFCAILQQPKT